MLEDQAPGGVYGAWLDDYDSGNETPTHLVKTHRPNSRLEITANDVVLTSRRDLRDIAASAVLMGWCESDQEILDFVRGAVEMHGYWQARATAGVAYEEIVSAPGGCVEVIAHALGIEFDDTLTASVLTRLDALDGPVDGARYNQETLLHESHRRHGGLGYYPSILASETIEAINSEFEPWLKRYGHL